MLADALRIRHGLGVRTEIVDALSRFASTLAAEGRAETTAKLLACSETLRDQIGSTSLPLVRKEERRDARRDPTTTRRRRARRRLGAGPGAHD